ncbi:peptidase M55, D-aminopeptidase [Alkaliphilus metalliredigens QYMF]|uniref:Peptidase M55, D-aminopeptidase n=2 Tax=Alkaliphilus TaxID=114627 RepID=A6TVS7_ALKMQ|nr:peptidase M55, D-aminopeptidase [Alkaliphilus metalliredigens QYMF]
MKVFISADIEGIWGVVSRDQADPLGKNYERARKLMTEEINWVVEEAFNAGAKEVVINDSHGRMDNLLIEQLYPRAVLISGSPKPLSMMQGIDQSYDAVIFIGYHPRAGTSEGIFDHTYAGSIVASVKINGKEVGECGLNAGLAGYFDVPVVLVSGDDKVVAQSKEEIGTIEGVVVKETMARYAAKNCSLEEVKKRYKEAIQRALGHVDQYPLVEYEGEIELELAFNATIMTEVAMLVPGVKRKGARCITYSSGDYLDLYRLFRALIILAGSTL